MLEPVTLDQLRILMAIVETGSFSAAARRLSRAQSAVSHAVLALGTPLFDIHYAFGSTTILCESDAIDARAGD